MAKRDYLVEAAKQIRMALDREVNEDYEAAFSYYKNGVDLLLNGVQLDPNKDRREAVKRKTTQYLKRAEEIFISHLQDNLGKGSSHLGGYSSLRFRPIRHLSSPVEDLEMCKVVGVVDKVLIVQSLVNKETFVVKSLAKSSWESRDQPTIIPQGVPYMVKLLRYYVSEDAVYLHLEHVQGGRLFSKLHKLRSDAAKQHRESLGPVQHGTKLKNSHTSPAISTQHQHNNNYRGSCLTSLPAAENDDDSGRGTESATSWHETQQRLESCGTHSYIEETGCLQNTRSAASFYARLERPASLSEPAARTAHVNPRIHPPAPSLCLQSKLGTQETPALPLACARVSHALGVMSEIHKKTAGMGLIECSSEFEVAWKTADPAQTSRTINPYAVAGADLSRTQGPTSPPTNKANPTSAETTGTSPGPQTTSSSPAILQIPFECQTQMHGRAPWIAANGPLEGSALSNSSSYVGNNTADPSRAEGSSPTADERNAIPVIKSTDRAVFSECTDTDTALVGNRSSSAPGKRGPRPGISLDLSGVAFPAEARSKEPGEEVEEAWELLSPGGKNGPAAAREGGDPYPSHPTGAPAPQRRRGDMDAFLKSEGQQQEDDHIIEVDGWCYLPRFPTTKSPTRADEKAGQAGWGTPEAEARVWGAQILLALESLHQQGVLCRDLNPKNILLTSNGKVCLSFFGQWSEVQSEISPRAMEQMYCAPEIGGVSKITEACDWWSLGALLFELLTGMPLWQLHPAGIHSHTQLFIPDHLSPAAASLLTELLQFDAGYRLGSGGGGVSDIKCHPFFSSISWKALSC